MENYFKKGAQVVYHYKKWERVYWSDSGYGKVDYHKSAVLLENPRDEFGRFTNDFYYDEDVTVKLKDEDGKIFTATIAEIEPDVDITSLSHEDLKKLWGEISRGSMYYSDYRNSLGVFENNAMAFYEGFYEELVDRYGEENADEHDTADNFAEYCESVESYGRIAA